jgi:hypothetical protein
VPPDLVERSHRQAFAQREPAEHPHSSPHRPRRRTLRRPFTGVAIAATAAVAVALAISSSPGHTRFRSIATLAGSGDASGYVAVGPADGAVEPVMVSISHLRPAPAHHYYEIWFQTGTKQVPGVAFNADANGRAEIRFTAPANTTWVRCWITRQSLQDPNTQTLVMRATGALQPT